MTKLDEALKLSRQDKKAQPLFYDLFLNSLFFIPVIAEEGKDAEEGALPLLIEAEGTSFLMIFDTIKRLTDWAEEDAKYVTLPGHAITEMSLPHLHWAMNYGTEFQKQFETDEIDWLKDVIRQAKEDEQEQADGEQPQEQAEEE
jgi:SseB protein N-terminal domain